MLDTAKRRSIQLEEAVVFSVKMGGSRFFFIESKSFELSISGGGSFPMRIFEKGKDSVRSVFMGKMSANRFVKDLEDLYSKTHHGDFVRTTREGDKVFIMQRCSNDKGQYVLVQEIQKGGRRGSIIIPEGRNGSGWQGFHFKPSRFLQPELVKQNTQRTYQPANKNIASDRGSFAAMVSGQGRSHGEGNGKGKEKISGEV